MAPHEVAVAVALVAIAAVALLAREGDEAFTPDGSAGDQPVLEVRFAGVTGNIPSAVYTEGPVYTVMLDGRLVVGQQSRPSTLLRVPSVVDIGTDRVAEVIATARAIGLPDVTDEVDEAVVDTLSGPSGDVYWTFRYVDKAGDHELAILSLDTAVQTLPDERYITLHDLYFQLQTWAFEAPGLGELPVERIEVMVVTTVEAGSVAGFDPAPWPLDQTVAELPEYFAGIRCTVVTGRPTSWHCETPRVHFQPRPRSSKASSGMRR